MNIWRQLKLRLIKRPSDQDLDDEIRSHLTMAVQDRIGRGEPPAHAEHSARKEFGNELLVREVTREMWGWTMLDQFAGNLNYAARQLRRSPGFSIVAISMLALGLSATTAMFSIVNSVLLQPLSFREPGRLYVARTVPPASAGVPGDFPVNARHYDQWRANCRSCESVSLIQFLDMTIVGSGEPAKLPALTVSSSFFETLGVQPALGRAFRSEHNVPGPVVILTNRLWRTRFASDPGIVGRSLQLNGESYQVLGVMPEDLHLPKGDEWGAFFGPTESPLLFRGLLINPARAKPVGNLNYTALIRLKQGVSASHATAELNALLADFVREFDLQTKIRLIPLQDQVTRTSRSALWLLLGTVATVLLIVCVNVGNLIVVRTTSRFREAAVRLALGASRSQLFSLILVEAMLLVAIGGVIGLALCYEGLKIFVANAPAGLPRLDEVQMDWRVMTFAAFAVSFSTIACGLFPAWRLSRVELHDPLKARSSTSTESYGRLELRQILVGLEVALSTVLLILGGLLTVSFLRVMNVSKGFDVAHIVTQDVSYLSPRYAHGARRQVVADTVSKLFEIPGVEVAAAINLLPLRGDDWVSNIEDPAQPPHPAGQSALANFRFVTPGYWSAMGIPLKSGRFLNDSDQDRPRAVISERAARFLWPNRNPLGQRVLSVGVSPISLEVVGVVGEVRASGLEKNPPMMVYEHYWRMQPIGMSFVLRTASPPAQLARSIRAILSSLDPEMALPQATTMEQIVDASVATRKFQTRLAAAFAAFALLLASLGIYGMTSFTVARRTPEIGIRIALGAQTPGIVRMVVLQGMRPVLAGLAAGLAGALFVGRLAAHQLFGVSAGDPLTMAAVSVILILVALLACLIPARRAVRTDPLTALRFE